MGIGVRIKELRKALKLTQEQFATRLKIKKGYLSNLEKEIRQPSDQLVKLMSLEYTCSENWLKTGEGEMFVSPEETLKKIMARYGEQTINEIFRNIIKTTSLDKTDPAFSRRVYDKDPELKRMIDILYLIFTSDDERLKAWASVQFDRAFPEDVIEEAQKKRALTYKETAVS